MNVSERTIRTEDKDIFTRRVSPTRQKPDAGAVLVVHGGPGAPHDYLRALDGLAEGGRDVVYYDQSGCGRSSPLREGERTLDHYVQELAGVVDALGLRDAHILGHSWGGMLAIEYALRRPPRSLVLTNSPASMPEHAKEIRRLRDDLPADVRATLDRHERDGTTDAPAYEEACAAFYARHLCRADPWPAEVVEAFGRLNHDVYRAMWGPSELLPNGTLASWDATARLPSLRTRTLVVAGRHDEVTPHEAERASKLIPGARLAILENSSHLPFVEEREAFLAIVSQALAEADA